MPRADATTRQRVGFLGHQVAEYSVGAALVAVGLHLSGAVEVVLVAVGAVLVLLNLSSRGRLGAWRVVGRRAHHLVDLALVAALAFSPLTALQQLHVLGVVVAEVLAIGLLWIERTTRYVDLPVQRPPSGASPGPSGAERAGVAAARAVAATRAGTETLGVLAPPAAALAGRAARGGARRLGVAVGRTRRVLRAAQGGGAPPARSGPDEGGGATPSA